MSADVGRRQPAAVEFAFHEVEGRRFHAGPVDGDPVEQFLGVGPADVFGDPFEVEFHWFNPFSSFPRMD
jgi:hypothetical protein